MTGSAWQVTKSVARSRGGVVAAQSRQAAEIGAEILRAGGNAVDAAIATSLALGCVEPWMSGLGGGGCMLAWFADSGRSWALDFGMIAPRRLDPSAYPLAGGTAGDLFGWPAVAGDRNLHGPGAVAVPGLADGLRLAHERFGSLPLRELAAPAIALADAGLTVDWYTSQMIAGAARDLRRYPDSAARWLPDGLPPVPPWTGEPFRLSLDPLAQTLRQLVEEGLRSFYTGGVAETLLADCERLGIPIDAADLAGYAAGIGNPLAIGYRGGHVLAMPGLYAGTSLARGLGLLEGQALEGKHPDAAAFAAYGQALLQAYRERLDQQGEAGGGNLPSCTSHLSVVDRHGNLVALTQTLLSSFGSKLLAPGTGLLLNNGIMWFDPRPGRANSIAAGGRPLSNMCPALGLFGARRFALGASGGRRILPAVLQLTSFLADFGMGLADAFAQPRIDVSGPELVTLDARLAPGIEPLLPEAIAARRLAPQVNPLLFGCAGAVLDDAADGWRTGMTEPLQPAADAVAASGAGD